MRVNGILSLLSLCDVCSASLKSEMCNFFNKHGYPASVVQAGHHRAQQIDGQYYKRHKESFSRYQAPTNSVAPSFFQLLDSLRRRANARNVSFRISLRWPIHIINPVDKTKLPC